jgi:hypothetical protein
MSNQYPDHSLIAVNRNQYGFKTGRNIRRDKPLTIGETIQLFNVESDVSMYISITKIDLSTVPAILEGVKTSCDYDVFSLSALDKVAEYIGPIDDGIDRDLVTA